jgi:two-component sensor histidine kinase
MEPAVVPTVRNGGWARMSARVTRSALRYCARHIPYRPPPFWRGQLIAIICTAAGTATRLLLNPFVHGHIPVVVFYPFVLVASVWGGSLAGLTVLVLGAVIAHYLWLPPTDQVITLTAFGVACLSVIVMARLFRVLVELHVEGEERAILLAHELKHRTNNLFGVVQAISAQTARNAASVEDHQASFTARLMTLARAQQLVSENLGSPPDLRAFLTHVIEPFGTDRFRIEGPAISVPRYLGISCALLLHELSTNATKYGALSVPDGRIAITWRTEADRVRLDWRELDGPPVATPARAGFGSRLLKTAFPSEYGTAEIAFDPGGVRCTVFFALL